MELFLLQDLLIDAFVCGKRNKIMLSQRVHKTRRCKRHLKELTLIETKIMMIKNQD